jgi:hypothetical protein
MTCCFRLGDYIIQSVTLPSLFGAVLRDSRGRNHLWCRLTIMYNLLNW